MEAPRPGVPDRSFSTNTTQNEWLLCIIGCETRARLSVLNKKFVGVWVAQKGAAKLQQNFLTDH